MKDAYYFSHDAYARHYPELIALRSIYGMEGYGMYWALIEFLREQADYRLSVNGKYDFGVLAKQLECDEEKAKAFIDDCIKEFRLLTSDGEYLWSENLLERMKRVDEMRTQKKEAAKKRWNKEIISPPAENIDADAMHMQSLRNADAMQRKEMKGNENKLNDRKRKESIGNESGGIRSHSQSTGLSIASVLQDDDFGVYEEPDPEFAQYDYTTQI